MKNRAFNILVADDDHEVCFIVSTVLRSRGHAVEVASNGNEAINLFSLKPGHFDVLITNHDMLLSSGLDVVHHPRNSAVQPKIIVISGTLTSELESAFRNKRVDKILQKPFVLENLSHALNDTLDQWSDLACA